MKMTFKKATNTKKHSLNLAATHIVENLAAGLYWAARIQTECTIQIRQGCRSGRLSRISTVAALNEQTNTKVKHKKDFHNTKKASHGIETLRPSIPPVTKVYKNRFEGKKWLNRIVFGKFIFLGRIGQGCRLVIWFFQKNRPGNR